MQIPKFSFLLGLLLILPVLLYSQVDIYQLNEISADQNLVSAKTVSGDLQERLYYRLNKNLFEDTLPETSQVLRVETEKGTYSDLRIERVSQYTPGTVSIMARGVSDRNKIFSFTYSNGRLNGLFHQADHSTIYFEHDQQLEENYIAANSPFRDDELQCGVNEHHAGIVLPGHGEYGKMKSLDWPHFNPPNIEAMRGASLEDEITIDLMIVYTDKAEQWANDSQHGSIEEVIAQSMNLSETALENSDVGIRLRLVHVHKTDYDEDGEDSSVSGEVHLRRLSQNPNGPINFDTEEDEIDGFMDEVHNLRNEYGADLVALFPKISVTGGIAWLNNSTAGNPALGFSVNRVQQVARTFTLVHEVGHNFGSAHSRTQEEAAAGSLGGLFKYSTGYQIGSGENQRNTVMAYNESGASGNNLPFFSSPDITTVDGFPAGSERSNNVLGFSQVKRSIASYRNTVIDPPVINVSPSAPISVNLSDDEPTQSVPVTISNSGDSDLSWNIDFDMTSTSFEFMTKERVETDFEIVEHAKVPAGDIPMDNHMSAAIGEDGNIIYQTGFEPEEGFLHTGSVDTLAGWRVLRSGMRFETTSLNPASGNQHLRVNSSPLSDETVVVRAPFFGVLPMGDYEFSADIAINRGTSENQERFDIYLMDTSPFGTSDIQRISAGIIISDGRLHTHGKAANGNDAFHSTNFQAPVDGEYFNLRIVFDASTAMINYYANNVLVRSLRYTGPNTPDFLWILNENETSDGYIDVDNVKLERTAAPFKWMDVDRYSGVSSNTNSQDMLITFTAAGAFNGIYTTDLIVNSNDPNQPITRIPVEVTINLDDPIGGPGIPEEVTLSQNFPNPFNPTTNIRYALDGPQQVTLEVYNITGRKIATLVDQQQPPGSYQVPFNGAGLSSGVYIYRLQTPSRVITRKMMLVK